MDLRLVSVLSHRSNLAIFTVLILTAETNSFYKELFSIVRLFTADLLISQLLMQTYNRKQGEVKILPVFLFTFCAPVINRLSTDKNPHYLTSYIVINQNRKMGY
jgi:hypothetical protein